MSHDTQNTGTVHDPDRDGTTDPGSTPAEHLRILGQEVTAFYQQRRRG